ncbi:MFS transporter [Kitasatospora sp. NPDC047058]|uniref:MFS transporter n=1 Tax=Kitasatospora sp. NPDC047058 TaxID=3155620 RepID=UPI0033CC27DE
MALPRSRAPDKISRGMTVSSVHAAQNPKAAAAIDPNRVMAVCTGVTFMAFLDFSVVNIAFPEISADFANTSINTMTWTVSGYAVTFAALLATGGRVADSIGRRTVFLWSVGLFILASLGCGLAPSIGWLIAARFVQGAASGGMVPSALGLILSTTPRERIGHAISVWTTASGFSAVIGPAVGGVLLEAFDWRWVFLINLPIGLLLLLGGVAVLPRQQRGSGAPLPDPLGSVLLTAGIAGVVSALTEADSWGWHDPRTLALGLVGLALTLVAVVRSRSHRSPAIDLALWGSRTFAIANVGLGLLSATMFAWMLGAPLFAASIWHWSVLTTAGALCVGGVASMAGALTAGRLVKPTARVKVAVLGSLLFAGSNAIWASSLFGAKPNFVGAWLPASILGGGGLGLALTCLSTLAAGVVPPLKFAGGLGMMLSARQVGGAVGVAGFATILASGAAPGSMSNFHHAFDAVLVVNVCCAVLVATLAKVIRPATGADPAPAREA